MYSIVYFFLSDVISVNLNFKTLRNENDRKGFSIVIVVNKI